MKSNYRFIKQIKMKTKRRGDELKMQLIEPKTEKKMFKELHIQ